jgi:hypothetical protein
MPLADDDPATTHTGATGVCIQCPADTYRAADDSPEQCLSCPTTSQTFALGATSSKECLCAQDHFNAQDGVNGTFSCAPVPEGGWAPQADSRLFALSGFWRPSPNYTEFFSCASGLCLRELVPADENITQLGYKCREGHTGHLCGVCAPGFAYSGIYCGRCSSGQRFDEWGPAKRGGIIFISTALVCLGIFLLFFLPLCPRVEAALARALQPVIERFERLLGEVTAATRPTSHQGSRPTSAARPGSAALRLMVRATEEAPPPPPPRSKRTSHPFGRRSSGSLARRSTSIAVATRRVTQATQRRKSSSIAAGHEPMKDDSSNVFAVPMERPSRVKVFVQTVGTLLKIIVSFWQVVSSFSSNLYVPWPSIYYNLANSLNVVSLQVRVPDDVHRRSVRSRVLTRHRMSVSHPSS